MPKTKSPTQPSTDTERRFPEEISFDYLKSNYYREILVTGAQGGLTPRGNIQMTVFAERQPIPNQTVHGVNEDGRIGNEIKEKRLTRQSIIRSVESTLIMDLDTAKNIMNWLKKNIIMAEKIISASNNKLEK